MTLLSYMMSINHKAENEFMNEMQIKKWFRLLNNDNTSSISYYSEFFDEIQNISSSLVLIYCRYNSMWFLISPKLKTP